jgi:hypothetical protein
MNRGSPGGDAMPDDNEDAINDDEPQPSDEQGDEAPFPTGEKIEEQAKLAKRWYTTAEVIAHLRSLG